MKFKTNNEKENIAEKKEGGFSVGTSLILVTFVLLALVTFATISYVQARSDYRLTVEATDRSQLYYEANTKAQERAATINDILLNVNVHTLTMDRYIDIYEYYDMVRDNLDGQDDLTITENAKGLYISYKTPIDDNSYILSKLRVLSFEGEGVSEIVCWKKVTDAGEEPEEEPLHLLIQ
jgi:hypothetical protein